MYGNEPNSTASRPFGDAFVNGFDFDIEHQDGNQYYQYMIATLRSNFAKDSFNKYYITGAPQCPLPEPNMGTIIQYSEFDYLWIQFYNNNCALALNNGENFNYNHWKEFLLTTPSRNASLFIGLPASALASTGTPSGSQYYIAPEQVTSLINSKKSEQSFGGVMIWDAGYSDKNIHNECTYTQNIHHILKTGSACGRLQSLILSSAILAPAVYTPPAETTSSTLIQVPIWGQCGGQDYTGPTLCLPPYQCIQLSKWWSSCH
ncbi:glycoside hydrolase superfamily [Trichoderma barbatum]